MYDPNIKDFYDRVDRLRRDHEQGYAFEAEGALGRSHYRKPRRKNRLKFLLPVVFFLITAVSMKGVIYHFVGAQTYEDRVAVLQNGEGIDKLGAMLMQPDWVTLWIAEAVGRSLQKSH
jgi:ABC-type Fe3+ transport system permease subunit